MFLDILLIAVTVMHIQIVHSQNNVTLHTETATPYVCHRALQLKCTYTGTAPCCSGSRTWRVDGTIVMNTGVVNDPYKGKYREGTVSSSGKYFNLVIENLKQADLAKLYFCKYDFDDLLETVTIGKTCLFPEYLITNLGYMIAGNVLFGIITLVIIEIVIRVLKGEFWKDWIGIAVVAAFYVIVSFLLNNVIAGVVGMHALYCDPRMILAGSGTSVVGSISAFLTYKYVKCFTAPFLLARLLVLTSVEAIVIGVVDLVVIGKLFQGQCDLCGWRATGWAVLATVCTALGVVLLILKFVKKLSWKKAFVFSCLILGRTLVVDIVVAIPFGIYLCPCTGWKDPLFILLGIIYTGVVLFVFWPVLDAKEDNVVLVLMTFCGLVISVIGLIFYGIIHGNNPKGGKSQSVESGSSCWPICRVGQDPNTSSSGPEKVRRSPDKERADKKKERKPTEVVRPQPSRALPPMTQHLGTENTRRAEFETEMYKPRPLPSISGQSDSPRPLPKRTPDDLEKSSVQLKPLGDSISEKKKKKKRKKKETKLSDEDD